VAAAELVRPVWRRARLWLGLLTFLVVAAALVATLSDQPGQPFDPTSAHKDGSKALARLLDKYGVTLSATSSVATAVDQGAGRAVVVAAPDDYSTAQLQRLVASAARLVLVAPGTRAVAAVAPDIQPDLERAPLAIPACGDPGAEASGRVSFPHDTVTYLEGNSGATSCYGGALLTTPRLAVLGSAQLVRNDHLGNDGVAALDLNAITDSRRITSVVWLRPGGDTSGPGPASIWQLFPDSAYRAFWWLIALGALIAIWRARRLGAVVTEPLPVVVRSAEVVEGHGRLYARAGARDRAAVALRTATVGRLAARLALPRGATAEQVAVALAPMVGRTPAEVARVLAGPVPADDLGLLRLARDLDGLESASSGSTKGSSR
jgi:hypothetical protein